MKYLIAGLGNIGPEYELTRHNIGFLALDQLAGKHGASFDLGRHVFNCDITYKGRTLTLIKPTTYMNLSGKAVGHWLKMTQTPLENLLVITDDVALDYGKLRLKQKGSSGGHNGLQNIQDVLENDNYPRLRFGIGNNYPKGRQADYVLSNFSKDELIDLPLHLNKIQDIIYSFCTQGAARTMSQYNGKV